MAQPRPAEKSLEGASRARERDPAKELYDQACALLEAAQGVRAAADPRRSAPAIAAGLGCLEASLEALQTAVAVMRVASLAPASPAAPP